MSANYSESLKVVMLNLIQIVRNGTYHKNIELIVKFILGLFCKMFSISLEGHIFCNVL